MLQAIKKIAWFFSFMIRFYIFRYFLYNIINIWTSKIGNMIK